MDYLAIVNKVIQESASELDELTIGTWSSAEAGRRLYPRIKRYVAEAWKTIQMDRGEWEFNTAELFTTVYPRIKYYNGDNALAPTVGSQWRGVESNVVIEVRLVEIKEGAWLDGTAMGQIEFDVISGNNMVVGELFNEEGVGTGTFQFQEKGSYDFLSAAPGRREPSWTTFVAGMGTTYPTPVVYCPWESYGFKHYSFFGTAQQVPGYVSQDFEGRLVFYPQPFAPFNISFVYDLAPNELSAPTDVPDMPAEYHEWIAWLALTNLAAYDKNPDLFAYATRMETKYRIRAERELMPLISYQESPYNYRGYR